MSNRNFHQHRVSRRELMRGVVGGVLGTGMCALRIVVASSADEGKPRPASRPIWKLTRPKPALPSSYFWTWDHSTNWMLDDPGMLNFGCSPGYFKQPETYLEDYRRLTDLAAGLGVKGILIWGFLRDGHGGVESAKRVADYASAKDVAILPGLGTNHYGGVYYEGEHPYNISTFLRAHPDAHMIDAKGNRMDASVCPSHPRFTEWIQEGTRWLFKEFAIGGANLENGDFLVCHCSRCRARDNDRPREEPAFWYHQYLGYSPVLQAIAGQLSDKLVTWATYKDFVPGRADSLRPGLFDKLPPQSIAQWTLTHMVRRRSLPLTAYLDDGAPADALANDLWPTGIKPPTARSVGFLHQGSQWASPPRYELVVGSIKEGCLRAYRAGLEGVSIHGEVSSMHVPWALNYLAFSHFIHWPEDSLRAFGAKTLGEIFGSASEGEAFAELLAHWDAGTLSERQKSDLQARSRFQMARGGDLTPWRFWHWLAQMSAGYRERHSVSVF